MTSPEPGSAAIPRRSFLRSVAGGSVAIAAASLLPAGCAREYGQAAADGTALEALTAKEYAVMRAAAEAILVGVPVAPAVVARQVDRELAAIGEPVLGDMRTVLLLFEHLPFVDGRARRFTQLSADSRLHVLHGWSRSRFALRRGAYQAIHGFVYFFAYVRDETRVITGFEGPWTERFDVPVTPVDFGTIA